MLKADVGILKKKKFKLKRLNQNCFTLMLNLFLPAFNYVYSKTRKRVFSYRQKQHMSCSLHR